MTPETPDHPDTLCDHCANQPECDGHHQMCVDFEPRKGSGELSVESGEREDDGESLPAPGP